MTSTIDQTIMQNILALLQTISVANGFNFDMGTNATWGKITNTADNLPCIFLLDGDCTNHDDSDDTPNLPGKSRPMNVQVRKRVQVEAHVPCDVNQPNLAGHLALQDLKAALFIGDRMFSTSAIKSTKWVSDTFGRREDGTKVLPVMMQFDVTYPANQAAPNT